jgi:hypothetical protein
MPQIELCFHHIGLAPKTMEVVALPPSSRNYCAACGVDRITDLAELITANEGSE